MPKQILFSDEGRAALLRGVNVMAAAVKATMGPKGRNVAANELAVPDQQNLGCRAEFSTARVLCAT